MWKLIVLGATGTPNTSVFEHSLFFVRIFPRSPAAGWVVDSVVASAADSVVVMAVELVVESAVDLAAVSVADSVVDLVVVPAVDLVVEIGCCDGCCDLVVEYGCCVRLLCSVVESVADSAVELAVGYGC